MSPTAIISYDDTLNDHDALMLGRILGEAGASLMLAYVRHTTSTERAREELEDHQALKLLDRGARWLDDLDVERRVVVSASTAHGLRQLAEQEQAAIIVFGSDYRTAVGHISPQRSTQKLLDGGPAALALAPAGYRAVPARRIGTIGVLSADGDRAAWQTAFALGEQLDATVGSSLREADLLVVSSRPEARPGQVLVSSRAQNAIEEATVPVLVVAREMPLSFALPLAA